MELVLYTGEWFCCRGFRQIVAGRPAWRVESFVSNEDEEYIGNIL